MLVGLLWILLNPFQLIWSQPASLGDHCNSVGVFYRVFSVCKSKYVLFVFPSPDFTTRTILVINPLRMTLACMMERCNNYTLPVDSY